MNRLGHKKCDSQALVFPGLFLCLPRSKVPHPVSEAAYWAVLPPSITNSLPVMNEDSSEARNRAP